jgi:predicted lipid-binding transport protein (Tim44 family)
LRRAARTVVGGAPYVFLAASVLLLAVSAWARPGGGQSFGGRSGGGSGSSGSGGGGGGGARCAIDVVIFLVQLTFEHPVIGIPLDLVVLAIAVVGFRQYGQKGASWSTAGAGTTETAAAEAARVRARPSRAVRRDLQNTVTRADPEFSLVLFEDFLYALYAAVHEARGKNQLGQLAAYLGPAATQGLARHVDPARGLTEVRTVVIGALRYLEVEGYGQSPVTVTVQIEANYTEVVHGREHTFYVVEDWTLTRPPTARSRTPEKAAIIGCPNCGAPLSALRGSQCSYCKQNVDTGQFDWRVVAVQERDRMDRPPQLTSDTVETGTDLPTVVDPDAGGRMRALAAKDPAFQWPGFLTRVGVVFAEIQPAWSTLEWVRARPYVSDQLFQMLAYWIESYKRAHLRNLNEKTRITGIELAAVVSDRYYDAVTVRIRATGLDYTVDDAGKVVSGSNTRERAYTEYWTLIRGTGVHTRRDGGPSDGPPNPSGGPAPPAGDKACPNCGAPLAINLAGSCTYCNAKVTSGEFDWVLSRIEQDEAYSG